MFGLGTFVISILTAYKGLMTADNSSDNILVFFYREKSLCKYEPFMKEKKPNWTAEISKILQMFKGST